MKKHKAQVARDGKRHAHRQASEAQAWSDAKFYTVLVFDAGNQCQAFIDFIQARAHLSESGDLFLDGRAVADAIGCELPEPSYKLKPRKSGAKRTITKKLARKGDGSA